jgi:hypothetical protein
MSTRNKTLVTAGALLAAAALASAQTVADPRGAFNVTLPQDGPLALVSADWGPSGATARGGAVVVDLHSTLVLRNTGGRRIRGVSLLVLAQEVTPGGKASVTTPSLNVGPGESFPVRVDLRLMRPPAAPSSALVEVGLDGVLFDDLSFYGPNRLNSRRTMLAWEMEARRDRRALVAALDSGGPEALRKILVAAFARDAALPRLDMQLARGRATNAEPEHQAELACLRLPDAPVDLAGASAWVSSAEARAPRITVRSLAKRPIRYLEVGWLVRDAQGREVLAGTLPADLNRAGTGKRRPERQHPPLLAPRGRSFHLRRRRRIRRRRTLDPHPRRAGRPPPGRRPPALRRRDAPGRPLSPQGPGRGGSRPRRHALKPAPSIAAASAAAPSARPGRRSCPSL